MSVAKSESLMPWCARLCISAHQRTMLGILELGTKEFSLVLLGWLKIDIYFTKLRAV